MRATGSRPWRGRRGRWCWSGTGTPPVRPARHAHEDVRLCLSLDLAGSYWHRGGWHLVPRGGLSVVGAGEVHASRDLQDRSAPAHYLVLYTGADLLAELAGRAGPRASRWWCRTTSCSAASSRCTGRTAGRRRRWSATARRWRRSAGWSGGTRTGRRVSRVAQDAGFYDESHLHRHFTRIVGVPPGTYRKHVQAGRNGRS